MSLLPLWDSEKVLVSDAHRRRRGVHGCSGVWGPCKVKDSMERSRL
jgi:hypothetical protein